MKVFMVLALSLGSLPAFAESYPLRCRGGFPDALGFQLQASGESLLNVRFKPGAKPAPLGLAPGECSWMDRGMRAGEPAQLCQKGVKDITIVAAGLSITGMDKPQLLITSQWSKSAPWLDKIRDSTAYINVSVASDGRNCLMVTGILP